MLFFLSSYHRSLSFTRFVGSYNSHCYFVLPSPASFLSVDCSGDSVLAGLLQTTASVEVALWNGPNVLGLGTEPCIVAESVAATKLLISSDRSLSTSLLSFSRDYSQILCHIHSKQELGLN